MNKAYILSGTFLGDEGKGSMVDYMASINNIKHNIRYNGGNQAAHTVEVGNKKHTFSQLGSTMFIDGSKTYLSKNTTFNPFNILEEVKTFDKDVLNRIYIDKDCLLVTPYHELINKIEEYRDSDNRRGSVGTGVSIASRLKEEGLYIKAKEMYLPYFKDLLYGLFDYTKDFYLKNINEGKHLSKDDIYYLTECKDFLYSKYMELINKVPLNMCSINDFVTNEDVIMEGSQGLLIDKKYGIKPNTTFLDTTNKYGVEISKRLGYEYKKIGITRAFASRHGPGLLPTEDAYVSSNIFDHNQKPSYFQGTPRYGWFDAILSRYSQSINDNDEICLSGIDQLNSFDTVKICNSYRFKGNIDEAFNNTFDYTLDKDGITITTIKNNNNLKEYLSQCVPIYEELKGWKYANELDIPTECLKYIERVEAYVEVPIKTLSFGPKRENKARR